MQAAAAIRAVEIAVQAPALSFPTGCALHVVASQKIKRSWSCGVGLRLLKTHHLGTTSGAGRIGCGQQKLDL